MYYYIGEFWFSSTSVHDLRSAIENAATNTVRYDIIDSTEAQSTLFQRNQSENDAQKVYPQNKTRRFDHNIIIESTPSSPNNTLFITHKTRSLKFVDDMVFAFFTGTQQLQHQNLSLAGVRVYSMSRIGAFDWGQNKRNIMGLMKSIITHNQLVAKKLSRSNL